MKQVTIVFTSLLTIIFTSCGGGSYSNIEITPELRIDSTQPYFKNILAKGMIGLKGDSVVKSVDYIPLETSEECLIAYISDVKFADSVIIISDLHKNKQVYLFDLNGEFVTKLSCVGNALNEYTYPVDVAINESTQTIYILDGNTGKLLSFDYLGNYIKSEFISFKYANNFAVLNDSIFVFDCGYRSFEQLSDTSFNLIKYNINQSKIVDKYFSFNNKKVGHSVRGERFSKSDTTLYYWEQLGTRAYRIDRDSLVVVYELEGIFDRYPSYFKSLKLSEFYKKSADNLRYGELGSLLEFKNWFFARLDSPSSAVITFTNKLSKTSYWDASHMYNQEGIKIMPNLMKMNDSTACSWIDAINFEHLGMFKDSSINTDSNPVIIVYNLK